MIKPIMVPVDDKNEEADPSSSFLVGSGGGGGGGVAIPGKSVVLVGRPATMGKTTKLEDLKQAMAKMGLTELEHQSSSRTVYFPQKKRCMRSTNCFNHLFLHERSNDERGRLYLVDVGI